ncbi:MAG: hypothetical protein IPK16_13015 [Anaerolineales bacterium]|nr:hypothetical protein [Anaerolineales bacterium]
MSMTKVERRQVAADLIEATPGSNGLGFWLLASPMLIFLAWVWTDFFAYVSPIPWRVVDLILALVLMFVVFVLPLGWLAHRLVTAQPRIFQNAGWDVQPLEPVRAEEAYLVHYVAQERHRAPNTWARQILRAAQGWVYLEIAAILLSFIFLIPLFLSAVDLGFGQ